MLEYAIAVGIGLALGLLIPGLIHLPSHYGCSHRFNTVDAEGWHCSECKAVVKDPKKVRWWQ